MITAVRQKWWKENQQTFKASHSDELCAFWEMNCWVYNKKLERHKSTGPAWWTGDNYSNKEACKITDSLKRFLENNLEYSDEEIILWEVLVSLTIKIVYLRKMKALIENLHKT